MRGELPMKEENFLGFKCVGTDENLRLQTSDPNAFNFVLKILKKIS